MKMKKYSVNVLFKNGYDMQFKTNTNVQLVKPVRINGAEMIITEETAFNFLQVEKLEVVEIDKVKTNDLIRN